MEVYKIESQGETDHVAVDGDILAAVKFYVCETGCDLDDIESISLFPREQWKDMTITFDEPEFGSVTVEDYMQGHTWNEVIASTNY